MSGAAEQLAEVVRVEGRRIVAVLARATGDLALAEDAVQDAGIVALEVWPRIGVPVDPSAWLYVAARRKALDLVRRESRRHDKELAASELAVTLSPEPPAPSVIRDDQLRLIFACCHPSLDLDNRVALALRTICGLSVGEIARALLVGEAAMAKRLVRSRQKLTSAGIPYRLPSADDLPVRLSAVCAVVHLVYTSGHAATGDTLVRADLCDEGVRLARLLVELLPGDPLPEALLALLLLTDARRPTRLSWTGEVVPLADQDRRRWDAALMIEGLGLLDRSLVTTGGACRSVPVAGGDRRHPRPGADLRSDRLAGDRPPLRPAVWRPPQSGRPRQRRRRHRRGVRSGAGAAPPRRGAPRGPLVPVARRSRRDARAPRRAGPGPGGLQCRRRSGAQRARAPPPRAPAVGHPIGSPHGRAHRHRRASDLGRIAR